MLPWAHSGFVYRGSDGRHQFSGVEVSYTGSYYCELRPLREREPTWDQMNVQGLDASDVANVLNCHHIRLYLVREVRTQRVWLGGETGQR